MASAISTNSLGNITTGTTATAAASHHSPRHSGMDNNSKSRAVGSPRSRRATRAASSPWTKIVRGESETIAAAPSSPSAASNEQAVVPACSSYSPMAEEEGSENGNGPGGNAVKRPAWNKPSNGAIEIGPVMGAASWPALSESARASTKSSSDSLKSLSDGSSSSSVPQVLYLGSASVCFVY
uniref:Uncharacterized protein n=1 Tax=Rhizophora mucronata TaxID=61149 RepID=A0A2P2MGJ6_RHIMU